MGLGNVVVETDSMKAASVIGKVGKCLATEGVMVEKIRKLVEECESCVVFRNRKANIVLEGIHGKMMFPCGI